MQRLLPLLAAALFAAPAAQAQTSSPPAKPSAPMIPMRPSMSMSSSIDLQDPMAQEASGTAWLPASSPIYAAMTMKSNGDMLMLHGAAMPRYVSTGSRRGDRRADAPNWLMGMVGHPLGTQAQLGIRAMLSADPLTEGGAGYPLLYQTGESWHHQPLHDHQHPHDLVSELAVSYSHLLGRGRSAFLYAGYPGEPALGPPTYMHRLLAYDLADAPLGHHWQDATHITFGVATAGLNFGSRVKLEGSIFTGREPDENRSSFDKPRFDSHSGRVSFNPNSNNALQASYGFIKNAEGDGANQHRITASWLYNKGLGVDANFTTAVVWGQNNLAGEGRTNAYLAEADWQRGRDTVFGRLENITKSGHELVLDGPLAGGRYNLNALTAGYIRDVTHGQGIDTGVGVALTADTHPSSLNSVYGGGTPLGFQVFLRLRPSRLKGMAGMNMTRGSSMPNMDMTQTKAMPNMDMSGTPSPAPAAPPAPSAAPPSMMPGMDMSPAKASALASPAAPKTAAPPPHAARQTSARARPAARKHPAPKPPAAPPAPMPGMNMPGM